MKQDYGLLLIERQSVNIALGFSLFDWALPLHFLACPSTFKVGLLCFWINFDWRPN